MSLNQQFLYSFSLNCYQFNLTYPFKYRIEGKVKAMQLIQNLWKEEEVKAKIEEMATKPIRCLSINFILLKLTNVHLRVTSSCEPTSQAPFLSSPLMNPIRTCKNHSDKNV